MQVLENIIQKLLLKKTYYKTDLQEHSGRLFTPTLPATLWKASLYRKPLD